MTSVDQIFIERLMWLYKKYPHCRTYKASLHTLGTRRDIIMWRTYDLIDIDLKQLDDGRRFLSYRFTDKSKTLMDFKML